MLTAIHNRVSRRTYTSERLSGNEIQHIEGWLNEVNRVSALTCTLIEDGSAAFSSVVHTLGLLTNVRSLVVLKGRRGDLHLREKAGYYGEELVLRLTGLHLCTCWVGGTYDSSKIPLGQDEELVAVITVGKVAEKFSFKEGAIRAVVHREVKPLAERLVSDTDAVPQWVLDGMQAVLLAPSARNTQKATFTYQNGIVTASISDDSRFDLVDLGIAKKHFELAADGKFELGNGGAFYQS